MSYFGLKKEDGESKVSYGSYLRIDELTGLQKVLSDPAQHDEMLFIVVHQVFELWFKQMLHEVDAVIGRMHAGEALGAQRLLRRCIEIQRVLIAQIKVLETMTPNDFLTFRDHLMPASGFQSSQFRALEFVSGIKTARHLENYPADSVERRMLEGRMAGESLGDALFALMRARGFNAPATVEGQEQEEVRQERIRALLAIYAEPDANYDLYMLCEELIEYDEMFTLWRFHHVAMVERMIGSKPGTGGSPGAAYLRKTVDQRFFPELWEMRTHLSDRTAR